jgi:2-(1,2-epoxy-1,2-dihydrophenyl)acetyl-CoA isomerase
MSDALLLEERHDAVAVLRLNDGARLNPLSPELMQALLHSLARVRDDTTVRAVLLTAQGRGFCVGADLRAFGQQADEKGAAALGDYVAGLLADGAGPIVQALRTLPVPVVCAVNGVAAGGGVGLALAADMVIVARSAYFYLPFIPSLGLIPDMGASWLVPRATTPARALGMALTGRKVGAQQAADWGMVWDCVDDADLMSEALALAQQLARLPAHAIEEARALFTAAHHHSLDAHLALERARQRELIQRPEFGEGVAAFAQRRAPVFRGRG